MVHTPPPPPKKNNNQEIVKFFSSNKIKEFIGAFQNDFFFDFLHLGN